MKRLLPSIIAIFMFHVLIGQNANDYLKTPIYQDTQTPNWAKEMYKQNPNVFVVDQLYNQYYQVNSFEKNIHTQNYKFWRKKLEPFLDAEGYVNLPIKEDLIQHFKYLRNKKAPLTSRQGNPWTPIGPMETISADGNKTNVSWQANIYTIDQSQSNENIVFAGSEAGGVFKTIDKGLNWQMASSNTLMRTIRSIKIHPTNPEIVYAGDGLQLFRTTDGGQNWNSILFQDGLNVNDISIHQENPNIVLVASNIGLFRSEDGGENWNTILDEAIWDIEQNTADPSQYYVLKSNEESIKTEFWKSTDHGITFSIRENGWYDSTDDNRINGGGKMTLTNADSDRIYVILIGASKSGDNGYIGIYKSENGGESWTLTDPPVGGPYDDNHPNLATLSNTNTLQQGYYNLGIAASDTDPNVVLIGCLNLWRTTDGGESFEALGGYQGNVSWIHPDQQEIEINGNDMWVANDGGINYSNDYFATHESRKRGILATDYWGFGSGWNDDLLVGGRYHNGNSAYRPSFEDGQFLRLGGGEAATGYVQPGGDQIAFFSDISAKKIPFSLDEAVVNVANLSMFPFESYFAANYSEIIFDPNCYSHMILGRENKLYKSINNGGTFDLLATLGEADDPVMQLEQSRTDQNVLYAYQRTTFYGAVLWVSQDGGNTWAQKDFPSNVSSMRSGTMSIHGENPGTLWVAFTHQPNDGFKVFRTDDYGTSWSNISEPILDGERIQTIYHHEGTEADIYIGTDYGIYYHNGTEWNACDNGLPMRLNNNKLLPFYKDHKLRTATYGNGIWETELVKHTAPLAQATVDKLTSNCTRDTFYFDDYSVLEHDENVSWEWTFSPDPIYISDPQIRNPKVVFGAVNKYNVMLTVSNNQGSSFFEKEEMIQINDNLCEPDIYPDLALSCFQNGNDFVQLPSLDLQVAEFTLSAWVKPNGNQNDYTGIIFNDDPSNGLNFSTNNQLGFHYQNAGSAAWAWQSGLIVPPDVWSHVAMVADSNGVTLYLNGVPSRRELNLEPAQLNTLKIGSYRGWTSRNYNGEMDEICIWERALSEQEIRTHRHITKNENNADGLVAYYQFNEINGRVLDRIGLKHGTITGLAQRTFSYAPVGGGTAMGIYGLNGIGEFIDQDITATSQMDLEDMLVLSKLDIAPQNEMIENIFPLDQYWIMNAYGQVNVDNLRINNLEIENHYETNPEEIFVYTRPENESENDFIEANNVHSATAGITGNISFIPIPSNSIQFILSKESISTLNETEEPITKLFPNPSVENLTLESEHAWKQIEIFDTNGIKVASEKIKGKKITSVKDLPAGTYNYLLISETKMKAGHIIKVY